MEKMTGFFDGPKIDVTATSGRLCVTVHPRPHWLTGFVTLGSDLIFAVVLCRFWSIAPVSIRAIWIIILGSTVFSSVCQFLGEEIIEIDPQKLTIRMGIHGWERTREYQINECSNFEWNPGRKGGSYLTCKVGRWPIKFGNRLSENDAGEIMSALQEALPDVAQKICTYPGSKEHFITLGLNKP